MASLQGQTLFITGASRGIGKEIALKAARDGANIVVAAKTAEPDPRLPGTIYSAAEEIVAAGGKALPLQLDIRDEDAVAAAIAKAVDHFGGIDILVNNASAISVTGTAQTPMKRYDLMMDINVRGTFVCSQAAIPHLRKSANPHILVLSPPLNLSPKWLGVHPAYTASKYGMSMIALGLAEEFKKEGIAVNCLWPKTIIATSALKVAGAGLGEMGRQPRIMAEAAYEILTRKASTFSGHTMLDEAVLRDAGVTDFDQYLVTPGVQPIIDLFVDEA